VTRKIITVEGTSGKDYVVSSGLQRGDRIVIEGADKLKDGTVITPKE
jgi:membrane fusion protein (multidrug efflux system)